MLVVFWLGTRIGGWELEVLHRSREGKALLDEIIRARMGLWSKARVTAQAWRFCVTAPV